MLCMSAMPPDLNSLPQSPRTMSINQGVDTPPRPGHPPSPQLSHSPTSASHSLAAAATLNAGLHNEQISRQSSNGSGGFRTNSNSLHNTPSAERRRSSIRMNLNINDPAIPAPGELQMSPGGLGRMHSSTFPISPVTSSHGRQPSLGELHQELENEQEAQVNRLLALIRQQQAQIASLQVNSSALNTNTSAVDDSTPTSERSLSASLSQSAAASQQNLPQPPHSSNSISGPRPRSPFHPSSSLSRNSSYRRSTSSSRNASPSIRPLSRGGTANENAGELLLGAPASTRDESAFYQAETQTLTRENQMLKLRIRELERQLTDMNPTSPITHSPATASALIRPPISSSDATSGETDVSGGESSIAAV